MVARFFRRLVAAFVLGLFNLALRLFNFISAWGFGGMRRSVPINRFVLAIVSWSSRVMADTDQIAAQLAAEHATLHFHRALAINAYANVEQSLCRLLAALLNIDWQNAAIIFYNVQNTHARNRIFDELLAKRHGSKYEAYWTGIPNTHPRRGMSDLIRQLDQSRNEIVHWHIGRKMSEDERGWPALQKPRAVPLIESQMKSLSVTELTDFIEKADFIERSLNLFCNFAGTDEVNYDRSDPAAWRVESWLQIFQQPALYPPPDSHPLSRNYIEPENPPQPSRA
jgi:hypothetical protein